MREHAETEGIRGTIQIGGSFDLKVEMTGQVFSVKHALNTAERSDTEGLATSASQRKRERVNWIRACSIPVSATYSRARQPKWWTGLLKRAGKGDCPFSLPQSKAEQRRERRERRGRSMEATQTHTAPVQGSV